MTINFTTTTIPTNKGGRKPLENPFTKAFPTKDDAALSVEITSDDAADGNVQKLAQRYTRQARQAAHAMNMTARVDIAEQEDGSLVFTTWTVAKQKHTRAPKAPKAAESK